MKKKYLYGLRALNLVALIILYYIVGSSSIFLYVMTLSLYNIFLACFNDISITKVLNTLNTEKAKHKVFKSIMLIVATISMLFLLLSVVISDVVGITLKMNNTLMVFVFMGLTIITEPFMKLTSEYLTSARDNKYYKLVIHGYRVIEKVLLLIVALLIFRVFKVDNTLANALLYVPKILSCLIMTYIVFIRNKEVQRKPIIILKEQITTKEIYKEVFRDTLSKSIKNIVKNTYYYISIIILYYVLKARYNYVEIDLEIPITFIYFYGLSITNYLVDLVKDLNKILPKENAVIVKIYTNFKLMLTIAIVFGIISPLICKVIFNNPSFGLYLMMTNFMAIFILLYDITYESILNKKVKYGSLLLGFLSKLVLVIPLIDGFYRMGFNLVFGDIISTIIAMFISVLINYIYIKAITKAKTNHFAKVLNALYENIILCIILILLEFIIPIDTNNYFKAIGLIILYIAISLLFIILKKKKKG